jgi:hypothetical protein
MMEAESTSATSTEFHQAARRCKTGDGHLDNLFASAVSGA